MGQECIRLKVHLINTEFLGHVISNSCNVEVVRCRMFHQVPFATMRNVCNFAIVGKRVLSVCEDVRFVVVSFGWRFASLNEVHTRERAIVFSVEVALVFAWLVRSLAVVIGHNPR